MVDLRCGDCLDVLPTLAENSIDVIVTDPPYGYGLGFMGKAAVSEGCGFVGIDLDAEYVEIARRRIAAVQLPLLAEGLSVVDDG